jgi:hypothetical protein
MGDNSLYVDPPEGYAGSHKWVNWHGYKVEVGGGYGPHLLNEIQEKRNNIEACIIVVTGSGGKGKTYFCLRLAEILDHKFDVDLQVPFGADELLNLISSDSPLGMGRVIIIDESQFTMSSRDWYNSVQKVLMKQLEAIRSKGFIIFIVALSEATLDNIARAFVITHKIHLFKRGHAKVYRYSLGAFSKKPYPTTISKDCQMALPNAEYCEAASCLRCQYSGLGKDLWERMDDWVGKGDPICQTIRAKYERKKKKFLETVVDNSMGKIEVKSLEMKKRVTVDDVVALMREKASELRLSNQGNIGRASAETLVRRYHPDISERTILRAVSAISQDESFCSKLSPNK